MLAEFVGPLPGKFCWPAAVAVEAAAAAVAVAEAEAVGELVEDAVSKILDLQIFLFSSVLTKIFFFFGISSSSSATESLREKKSTF